MKTPKYSKGMTLIEIMIVVVIVAILVMVVYSSYTEQIRKTRRSDAKIALADLAQRQENYFADNNQYASQLAGSTANSLIKFGASDTVKYGFKKDGTDLISSDGDYKLTISTNAGRTQFWLTATAIETRKQKDDTKCKKLILDYTSKKESKDAADNSSDNCW